MKDHLGEIAAGAPGPGQAKNSVREYLQARLLGEIQRAGAMVQLAFHGGTALRFLYRLPRFSEDLDFSLAESASEFDLHRLVEAILRELRAEGYRVDAKISHRTAVHAAMVSFPGLLHELGMSPRPEQALRISLEVDTRPPAGAVCETTLVRRHLTLRLNHHDRASLLAGKLHAVLQRSYPKGRDFFDLFWYLSDPAWPGPNLVLLGHALRQSGFPGPRPTGSSWPRMVAERLQGLDWRRLSADVEPFLEPGADAGLFDEENLRILLERKDA